MTPAPTTIIFFGTSGSAMPPVEEMTRFSSMVDARQRRDREPVAMTMFLVSSCVTFAVRARDFDLAGAEDFADAVIAVDLVLLEQERDAVDVRRHGVVLVLEHRRQIELRLHLDAERGEIMLGLVHHLGGMQQRLGGNAADIEAGAAEGLLLLDHRGLQAELRGADRAHIAAGAGADDDEVVCHHDSRD